MTMQRERTAVTRTAAVFALLGMTGRYAVSVVDASTGRTRPFGYSSETIATPERPPWGVAGFTRTRSH